MEQIDIIARVLDLGATGVLAAVLWQLWREFKEQNKFIRDLILQGEAERRVLARHAGLDTITLKAEAAAIRERMQLQQVK